MRLNWGCDSIIEVLVSVFEALPNIVAAYLFGSRIYGKAGKTSDYDVAVLFKGDYALDELLDITLRLAEALNVDLDSIDIVALNDAPVEVAYDILAKGKLVYSKDDELRVSYETRLMREYLDLKPYLDLYYDLLLKRILGQSPR